MMTLGAKLKMKKEQPKRRRKRPPRQRPAGLIISPPTLQPIMLLRSPAPLAPPASKSKSSSLLAVFFATLLLADGLCFLVSALPAGLHPQSRFTHKSKPIGSSSNNEPRPKLEPPPSPNRFRRSSNPSTGTVATNTGLVQGQLVQLPNSNIEVYEFVGIPFAEPPIGERRFRKPESKTPWQDILVATSRPNSCPQLLDTLFDNFTGSQMWNANTEMSEDCLYLNIWVPRKVLDDLPNRSMGSSRADLSPVLIWIYGGGFTSGTATLDCYDGRIFAGLNNIIVVSMQYRMGALGFLYFGNDDAPGNVGLWDQWMAMRWTCENIHAFGGNCKNTTLSGESAGAASVAFHLISPHSRDYFQRAILQSASALASWAVVTPSEAMARSNELVNKFTTACTSEQPAFDDTRWKIDCLRSQDGIRLPEEEWGVMEAEVAGYAQFPFVPVIDGDFVPQHPRDLLADGQYYNASILLGLNRNEGTYFMLYTTKGYNFFKHPKAPNRSMNFTTRVYSELIKEFFAFYPRFNRTISQLALDAVEFQYTPWKLPVISSQDIINAVDSATGDWAFACPVVSWADSYVELPPALTTTTTSTTPAPGGDSTTDAASTVAPMLNDGVEVESRTDDSIIVRLKREQGQQGGGSAADASATGPGLSLFNSSLRSADSIYSSIPSSDSEWLSKHKVFLYYFTHRSSISPWPDWMGVMHADEISYMFGEPLNYSKAYTEEEILLSRITMAYWSNFAKFGDPNTPDRSSPSQRSMLEPIPHWPEYTYYDKTFLEINVDTIVSKRLPSIGTSIKAQECAFWHGYLPKLDALSASLAKTSSGAQCSDSSASISTGSSLMLAISTALSLRHLQ